MDISELIQLTRWIDREIRNEQIPQRYETLRQVLVANARPNQPRQPFESQRDELLTAIAKVPLETLTTQQLAYLQEIGIGHNVGAEAVSRIEDILFRNALDIATAGQRLGELTDEVKAGAAKSDEIQSALDATAETTEFESGLDGKIMVRVAFSHGASISNVVDLKTWSNIWHEIGRGIAMIHDSSPEEIEVIGAGRGSIVIELAVAYGIATTISKIILEALKVTEKVLDIRKKAEEIRALKLGNDKIAKELDEEAEKEKAKGIRRISERVTKAKRKKDTNEGDKVAAFDKAVKNLVDFVDKGGEVDCVVPAEKEPAPDGETKPEHSELKELRATFKEIRHLEIHLKQIEAGALVAASSASRSQS